MASSFHFIDSEAAASHTMLLSHGGDAAYAPHDLHRISFTSQTADLSSSLSRAQALMQDGRHVDAASILTQYGRRQDMAAAEAVRMVEMLSECAQFCTGHSQDTVLLGIQMCRDAQTLAESAGLPPQQLLPVLLVRSPPLPLQSFAFCCACPSQRYCNPCMLLPSVSPSYSRHPLPPLVYSGARSVAAVPWCLLRRR